MLMQAMVLEAPFQPLKYLEVPLPNYQADEVLVQVEACGLCRTDLHIVDGELNRPKLPLIPGHQVVGRIKSVGHSVSTLKVGDRVGVPWLGYSCGQCEFCLSQRENLCDKAQYTGYQINGGFAEYCVANAQYCFPIPESYPSIQAAPLLCAGLIGYRAYQKVAQAATIGLYGFGAAAHLLCQVAKAKGQSIYAFTKKEDSEGQQFAKSLGAVWAGDSMSQPPCPLDAAIIFAPSGELVPQALKTLKKGGTVVCAGIHMSDIPSFPYENLWGERTICSIANLTRRDGVEFLKLAADISIQTETTRFKLSEANLAIEALRQGVKGAVVIEVATI